MTLENLFIIEDVLASNCATYMHVNPFIGSTDVEVLIGGILGGDNILKEYVGRAIIVWNEDELDREDLYKKIFRSVQCKGNEKVRIWFYVTSINTPIMVIPID